MRKNNEIRGVNTVQLISAEGLNLGTMTFEKALAMAKEQGLDLVELNKQSGLYKLMDYGKWKYDRKKAATTQTKPQEVKSVFLSVKITSNDLTSRANQIEEWLKSGHKVAIKLKFRGREITHPKLGFDKCNELLSLINSRTYTIENKLTLTEKLLTVQIKPS